MGLLCKNSIFVLKTKTAIDGHFRGLDIQVTAMEVSGFSKDKQILLEGQVKKQRKFAKYYHDYCILFTCGQDG